jgi:tRNA 5-methylaminomethyl-2-thiouridine biosynthesis bifunctional protein
MKTAPIQPAHVVFDPRGLPYAPDFGDVYHAEAGAFGQARHVFLGGNGLPGRWAGRERFVVLETGFGLGNNFLATWAAWRDDPQRCERLVFVSIERYPLRRDDLARLHAASPEPALAAQLVAQWPLLTPNLHLLDFEGGRVQLILAFGDVEAMLPELQAEVDALYLDGFAPAKNAAMWTPEVFRRVARLLAPGATAATWSASRAARDGLASIGFAVEKAPGFGGKRDMTVARWAPRFVPPRPVAFVRPAGQGPREALVLGGGLAGCAAAWGLARQGWHATVLDQHPEPAMGTSGNPGGLMHGIFNAPDGLHARWYRSAALHTARWAGEAIARQRVAGQLDGFLRLDDTLAGPLDDARAQLAAVGLDPAYVDALDAAATARLSGLPPTQGAWHYGNGGWLSPRDWARHLLAESGATWRGGLAIRQLRRAGPHWQALDAAGHVLAEAPVLVLAHATGARTCWPDHQPVLPLRVNRGQTTVLPAPLPGLRAPRTPLSGRGYALTLANGDVLIGATQQPGDETTALRADDQLHNLQRAAALGVCPPELSLPLTGRVGWRVNVADRLPLVGPLVAPIVGPTVGPILGPNAAAPRRNDALRHRARQPGVHVLTALGSRGLTSAALAGRVLAAWISGAPMPVESALRDAVDPARFRADEPAAH